jgi:hypothetical protein
MTTEKAKTEELEEKKAAGTPGYTDATKITDLTVAQMKNLIDKQRQKNNDPLHNPNTAFGLLTEGNYKAELELVDRYQLFTAEILRLSLLGIAVFGFLYKIMFPGVTPSNLSPSIGSAKILAALGIIMFGISAASALIFRYFATEGLRFYIEALRFMPGKLDCTQESLNNVTLAQESLNERKSKINVCIWSKATAAFTLGLGGFLVALALFLLLII